MSAPEETITVSVPAPAPTMDPPAAVAVAGPEGAEAAPPQPKPSVGTVAAAAPPAAPHIPPTHAPVPPPASAPPPAAPATRPSSKSKKKKAAPSIAMTAAPPAGTGAAGENTGRWTAEEHRLFLQGLELHGKGWKKIASLIKSRTVVQIRTHAQKYFQKLAKARQNGEEGEIAMDSRGGAVSVAAVSPAIAAQNGKRRRHTTGTKRKVIQSVVASAHRQGKKFGAVGPDGQPLPTAAPALAHFIMPPYSTASSCVPSITTAQGTISGPALEDSLFRFLTPAPPQLDGHVNDVARSAGANPITLPLEAPGVAPTASGEGSPTGVTELSIYPSWTDAKDTPSWYSKGQDVDALLDVSDTLDWLADTGDLHETYRPPAEAESSPGLLETKPKPEEHAAHVSDPTVAHTEPSMSDEHVSALPTVDANNVETVVPPLPSYFDGSPQEEIAATEDSKKDESSEPSPAVPPNNLEKAMSNQSIDGHLQVFDTPMEEHDFVSTILENATDSHTDLPALN